MFSPLLALALLGATLRCGTVTASSSNAYGLAEGAPSPSESIASDGKVITVDTTLGDRMFTVITSQYDAATLTLLSADRHASCCGSSWRSSIARSADGSYDVESQTLLPSQDGKDALNENRPHFEPDANRPIVVGGLFFVPWLHHATNAPEMVQIAFDPLRTNYLSISDAAAAPYPEDVPTHDKALTVISTANQTTTLWYDPCTFTLDAYGTRNGSIVVRRALIK